MMLSDLLELEKFTEGSDSCVFEAELWEKYGQSETIAAIESGLLEHRRLKFRDGFGRCICWLSDKGRDAATAEKAAGSILSN